VTIRATLCLLAVLACGVLPACGGDDQGTGIPAASASRLQSQLDSIRSRVDAGTCRDVVEGDDTNRAVVQQTIDSLPEDVDRDVRDALSDSFDRLFQLVEEDCEPEQETTPTETTPPPTIETQPETETQTTETAPPPKPKKEKKRDEQNGGGQGAPDGGGGGTVVPEGD
jgi:hypothetical protein